MTRPAWLRRLFGGPCWTDTGERRREVLYDGPYFSLERLQGREADACHDMPYTPALVERWVTRPKTAVAVFKNPSEVIPIDDATIEGAALLFNLAAQKQ